MKSMFRSCGVMILIFMMTMTPVQGAARVITEVSVLTDHSARISLTWSDDSVKQNIMITSWQFNNDGLTVFYQTGPQQIGGFNERVVEHETYTFPMAVYLIENGNDEGPFTDMSESSKYYKSVLNLYDRGIISGYPDGSFKPSNLVSRAEFSKMLLLTAKYELDQSMSSNFTDVSNNHWSKNYIMTLASREILKGKGNNQFDPEGQITIGEVLTVLTRTFNLYEVGRTYPYTLEDHWSNDYFLEAVRNGIAISSDEFYRSYDANEKATRETCANLLSRILENLHDVSN